MAIVATLKSLSLAKLRRATGNNVRRWLFATLLISTSAIADDWHYGTWQVTDVKFPGIHAMTESQAKSWLGTIARYSADEARFGQSHCSPNYQSERRSAGDFFQDFRFPADALNITILPIQIVEIDCRAGELSAGSSLIRSNENGAYTLWDGAFFKLERISH